jgi:hypothetical protein
MAKYSSIECSKATALMEDAPPRKSATKSTNVTQPSSVGQVLTKAATDAAGTARI